MKNIAFASIKTLRELLAKKEVSPQELVQASLQRIAQHDQDMKSFIGFFYYPLTINLGLTNFSLKFSLKLC